MNAKRGAWSKSSDQWVVSASGPIILLKGPGAGEVRRADHKTGNKASFEYLIVFFKKRSKNVKVSVVCSNVYTCSVNDNDNDSFSRGV
jgi:hypothetical protein